MGFISFWVIFSLCEIDFIWAIFSLCNIDCIWVIVTLHDIDFYLTSIELSDIYFIMAIFRLFHIHLFMQLLASEVSAEYYTHPPWIVSLLMLTITYMHAMALHKHTQGRLNNHAGSWSLQPVSWVWWKWEILCLELDSNPHL